MHPPPTTLTDAVRVRGYRYVKVRIMAKSLTVKHEESPSYLFTACLLLCGGLLLLGAAVASTDSNAPPEAPAPVEATVR